MLSLPYPGAEEFLWQAARVVGWFRKSGLPRTTGLASVQESHPSPSLEVTCGALLAALDPTELAHAVGILLAAGHGQRREQV